MRALAPLIVAIAGAVSFGARTQAEARGDEAPVFVPPTVSAKPRPKTAGVTIKDNGELFSSINTTDCLPWPSDEAKAKGGSSGWPPGWWPQNGARGVAVARAHHCFQDRWVVFVRMDPYWAAIGDNGLEFDAPGAFESLPVLEK